jgi:hypothetical protein
MPRRGDVIEHGSCRLEQICDIGLNRGLRVNRSFPNFRGAQLAGFGQFLQRGFADAQNFGRFDHRKQNWFLHCIHPYENAIARQWLYSIPIS